MPVCEESMIDLGDFKKAVEEAYEQFRLFVTQCPSAREFLKQPPNQDRTPIVQQFLEDIHKCTVVPLNRLQPGYASWLFSMGEGRMKVVYDHSQIQGWAKEQMKTIIGSPPPNNAPALSKFLEDVQTTRSLLHELGHLRLAEDLLANLRKSPPNERKWATAQEEQKAWVFAFCFLGLMLGKYAHETRQIDDHCDDAPKIIV